MLRSLALVLLLALNAFGQPSGLFDHTFNSGSCFSIPAGGLLPTELRDLAIQPDNRILAVGHAHQVDSDESWGVFRLGTDGRIDSTFGGTGNVQFGEYENDLAEAMVLLPDGRILVLGNIISSGITGYVGLMMLQPDGVPDASFGSDGFREFQVKNWFTTSYLYDMALDAEGRILVAGYSHSGANHRVILGRLLADGSVDTSFGSAGWRELNHGSGGCAGTRILQQSDGKIIVTGRYFQGSIVYFMAARFSMEGTLDTSFGTDGIATTPLRLNQTGDEFFGATVDALDRIVITGHRYGSETGSDFIAMRLEADGAIDTSFGTGGVVRIDYHGEDLNDYGQQVLVAEDGTILVGGQAFDSNNFSHFGIVALDDQGALLTDFGVDGMAETLGGYKLRAMAFDSQDRIVVGGQSGQGNGYWVGRFLFGESTSVDPVSHIRPAGIRLLPAAPNPFNPSTLLRIQLDHAMAVQLTVYDLGGRRVATLLDGMQGAGDHAVRFDGEHLSNGIYLVSLRAGMREQTGRVILLK